MVFKKPLNVYGQLISGYNKAYFQVDVLDSSTNAVISSNNSILYSPTQTGFYSVYFNNIPWTPTNFLQTLLVRARLITYQLNGQELIGKRNFKLLESGPKPIFLPLGSDVGKPSWQEGQPLNGFTVVTATLLTGLTMTILAVSTGIVTLYDLSHIPAQQITDPYEPFNGCFAYEVFINSLVPPINQNTDAIVALMASNIFGTTQPLPTGPITPP